MRILVVDDHELVRKGICTVLATEPAFTVCGEAIDGRDAVAKAKALLPDVVVMDVSMPNMDGLEATRQIKQLLPDTEVVVVSQFEAPEMKRHAQSAGAGAYIVKTAISTDLLAAIAKVSETELSSETAPAKMHLDHEQIQQRSAAFEKAFHESEERFRSAMNNIAEGVFTVDSQGLVTYLNPAAETMFGWTSAELLGKKMHDVTHYKHPDGTPYPAADCPGLQVLENGREIREHQDAFIRKDGSIFPVVFSASPLKYSGKTVGIVVGFRDDTKRREAEMALQLRAAIVDSSDDAIVSKGVDGIVTSWNRGAELLFGYTAAEAIGQHITFIIPPDRRNEEVMILAEIRSGRPVDHFETVRMHKDGSLLNISVTISPIRDSSGRVVGASKVARNITERMQIERALRDSEERFRAIVETTPECVKLVRSDGTLLHMNSSGLAMVGADCLDMVVGKNVYDLIAPHDRDRFRAFNEGVCRGEKGSLEFDIVGLGGVPRHMETHGAPLHMPNGTVVQLGVTRDITERTQAEAELRSSEERLRALTAELELKVQLRTLELEQRNGEVLRQAEQLRGLSSRLMQTQDEERRRIARELHDGVGQLLAAMSMNFSKVERENTKLDPEAAHTLEENITLVKSAAQEIRTISYLLHPPLLDEVGLESALSWFVDGFAERSKIAVSVDLVPGFSEGMPRDLALSLFRIVQECLTNIHRHSGSATAFLGITRSADEIRLEVKDEGKGMPEEIQSKISSGQSCGVGLSGMRERVRQFGGRLEVDSDETGTRITAVLPLPAELREAAGDSRNGAGSIARRDTGTGTNGFQNDVATILCIDDEAAGLVARKLLLESAGHRVIEARSGEEGIQLFKSLKVDAVILDYWMSGMKGTAVASELKRINPEVPIIMVSGMADLPGEAAGLVDQWIIKGTVRAEELLESIGAVLERRPA
jgi:PAS domain S-box-containing protein